MNSLEKISFLQEKLQDIRNHYLSLKSEVASIDRRRKRMKKKERESKSLITGTGLHHSQDVEDKLDLRTELCGLLNLVVPCKANKLFIVWR